MVFLVAVVLSLYPGGRASGVPLPGGTLDPLTIPKYVTPLVIPPVMPNRVDPATGQPVPNEYDIAVRQFKQQILPAGFPATTVWSYGPASDPIPLVNAPDPNSGFNYPAFTIETVANVPVKVRWRNELVAIDPTTGYPYPPGSGMRTFLPHLFFVDQTLHWANPPAVGCADGTNRTDCATLNPMPYTGPVPIVTHVHGAHVESHSDGYPEAWWLPVADNIPPGYAMKGSLFDDSTGTNPGNLGYVDYVYRNDQAAATIWYHDHSLGMTRLNVYAGPAGFWLIRGGPYDGGIDGRTGQPAVLPGPAPRPGDTLAALNTPGDPVRNSIREIPIVIQDRSFNADGSLFYPQSRVFFDGYAGPYVPDPVDPANPNGPISDIAPIWNPEAFFNTMVVNGTTWPVLEVAPALYRFRFLNGCDSRFLNLVMKGKPPKGIPKSERKRLKRILKNFPFYKIGNDQGFIPQVVLIRRGFATPLPGDGTLPPEVRTPTGQEGLLMGPAERADVIVDFRGLPDGTVIRVLNTAPDAPFGGFPVVPADPATTGQVMQFVVRTALLGASPTDPVVNGAPNPNAATDPWALRLNAEPPLGPPDVVRQVSLNEEESATVCVDPVTNQQIVGVFPPLCGGIGVPAAPKAALLGTVDLTNPAAPVGVPLKWTDTSGVSQPVPVQLQNGATVYIKVTENPLLGTTETWEIYNFTVDAHPIHLHLVRFQVVNREIFDPLFGIPGTVTPPNPDEVGYKDTVIAYPGQITRVKALFDISGLYVWHCHILEHEDNEMMRPFVVSP
ncbi:MAG: copper oxidase [Deltaproteobacteria bacterium]|nr:MAG: copper oxidase [Deltaproteobacteria bacterium]